MPELPEVEAVARALNECLSGRVIIDARLLRERLAKTVSPEMFTRELSSSKINFVHRRGKHLLFDLDNKNTLITHLRMSGKFELLDAQDSDPKFTHAVFQLDGGTRLVFHDQRHFGHMNVASTEALGSCPELRKLAPEPLSDDFDEAYFHGVMSMTSRSIKAVLLDQTKVCGLGNIYASESLYLARVNPVTSASRISRPKLLALLEAIKSVLQTAISYSASRSIDPKDFESGYYSSGGERRWLVYDREGQPCLTCRSPIKRIKQDGRSSYFCSRCQRRR
jgi:formamidopyrimidine-DNA glycosylase